MKKLIANIIAGLMPNRTIRNNVRNYIYYLTLHKLYTRKIKYDFVFSIGDNCFTTQALKKANLRKFSGPLDWAVGASFDDRIEMIINGFADCFDPDDFEKQDHRMAEDSDFYINKKTEISYWHDFPIDQEFELMRQKLIRRAERLTEKIAGCNKCLAVYVESTFSEHKSDQEICILASRLNTLYDGKMDLLYTKSNIKLKPSEGHILCKKDNIIMAEIKGRNEWGNKDHRATETAFIKILDFIRLV